LKVGSQQENNAEQHQRGRIFPVGSQAKDNAAEGRRKAYKSRGRWRLA
jgi:hypothetical protein